MSTAGDAVVLLDAMIRRGKLPQKPSDPSEGTTPDFCSRFQRQLARQLTIPWLLATLGDLEFPGVTTDIWTLKVLSATMGKLINRINLVAATNEVVFATFLAAVHMQEGYIWKFISPSFIWNLVFG
jgi:hypothetical protein